MKYKEIILRPPQQGDIDLLYRWENDRSVWQVSNTFAPYTRNEIIQHIKDSGKTIFETGQARYIICLAVDLTPVGIVDLFEFDLFHQRAGIGILIADESHRRKGYARMAVEAIIAYCFNHLKIHQLYCSILPDNLASIALFKGAGFTLGGTKRDWIKSADGYRDELFFQLIAPTVRNKH